MSLSLYPRIPGHAFGIQQAGGQNLHAHHYTSNQNPLRLELNLR